MQGMLDETDPLKPNNKKNVVKGFVWESRIPHYILVHDFKYLALKLKFNAILSVSVMNFTFNSK